MASERDLCSSIPPPRLHSPYPYDQVVEFVSEVKADRVLDVGAGTGTLAAMLVRLGLRVTACELEPESFQVPGVEIRRVDLNAEPLPFPDESFDLVTCCDVIEHLENPHALVRELRRVLAPRGRAILTVPNILNLQARLKTLLVGLSAFHRDLGERLGQVVRGQGLGHINPIPLQELLWIGLAYGLPVEAVGADYVPRGTRWLAPVAAAVRCLCCFSSPRSRLRYQVDLANSQPVLFGYRLVLSMVRSDDPPPVRVIPARRDWSTR